MTNLKSPGPKQEMDWIFFLKYQLVKYCLTVGA